MPTYISLIQWTQQGVENIKDSPNRLDRAKELFQEAGAEIKHFYMTMGRCDMVAITEAPDDATLARVALMLSSTGGIRLETLKAFTEEEYRDIMASLP